MGPVVAGPIQGAVRRQSPQARCFLGSEPGSHGWGYKKGFQVHSLVSLCLAAGPSPPSSSYSQRRLLPCCPEPPRATQPSLISLPEKGPVTFQARMTHPVEVTEEGGGPAGDKAEPRPFHRQTCSSSYTPGRAPLGAAVLHLQGQRKSGVGPKEISLTLERGPLITTDQECQFTPGMERASPSCSPAPSAHPPSSFLGPADLCDLPSRPRASCPWSG